jgi:hypothetical protein
MGTSHTQRVDIVADMYPNIHRSTLELVPFFDYEHLPEHLAEISSPFHRLVHTLLDSASAGNMKGPELTVALRKLLEAKDCAVRSAL